MLLGSLGLGAVIGVFVLPIARKRVSDNVVIAASAVLFAVGTLSAAFLPFLPTLALLVLAGLAWIGTMTVLNAALQLTLPQWVRSRGAAMYILVFMGTMAIGSILWGLAAQALGTTVSLAASAALLLLVAASTPVLPLLPGTGTVDRTISSCWPTPTLVFEPEPTDGPVLVTVTYTVRPALLPQFQAAMRPVASSRRRTGGYRWQLYRSGEDQDVMLESFIVPSWGEHRRQETQRLTGRDREIRADALMYSEGDASERHYFPTKPAP